MDSELGLARRGIWDENRIEFAEVNIALAMEAGVRYLAFKPVSLNLAFKHALASPWPRGPEPWDRA